MQSYHYLTSVLPGRNVRTLSVHRHWLIHITSMSWQGVGKVSGKWGLGCRITLLEYHIYIKACFNFVGAIMKELAERLLGTKECKFIPKHTNNLANEFRCYTNFKTKHLDEPAS